MKTIFSKKSQRKNLCILLCLFMMLSLFSGCNGKQTPGEDIDVDNSYESSGNTENSGDESLNSDDPDNTTGSNSTNTTGSNGTNSTGSNSTKSSNSNKTNIENPFSPNLGGKTITIAYVSSNLFNKTKDGSSKYNDAVADRTAKLEKELNCKIVTKESPTKEALREAIFNTAMSGGKYADILMAQEHQFSSYMTNKLLVDLNTVSTLDLSKDYMNSGNVLNANRFGNKNYGLIIREMMLDYSVGIFFNKKLLKPGMANPYDLVKNKEWTVSKMREMMKAVQTPNATDASGTWGMLAYDPNYFGMAMLAASGTSLVKNNNGNISYNTDSKEVMDAINLGNQIYQKDKTLLQQPETNCIRMFTEGRALFFTSYTYYVQKLTAMSDDFGYLPFPRTDKVSDIRSNIDHNASMLGILTGGDISSAGVVLQALCYESEKTTLKVKNSDFTVRYFRDSDSGKMLEKVNDSISLTPDSVVCAQPDNGPIEWGTIAVLYRGVAGDDPSALVAETKDAAIASLKEWLKKVS